MEKYIDSEKLKKLIDEKWKELADKNVKVGGGKWDAEISTYLSVLRLINSLQQKHPEVDLEKEIEKYYYENFAFISSSHTPTKDILSDISIHFYELGLKARKEE